jgi:hypothetical protein
MTARNAKPGAGGRRASGVHRNLIEYSKPNTTHLPRNWRDRMPDPASYYAARVAKLTGPNASGWCSGACPFHRDAHASLSVHVTDLRGAWRCFASCGGGDLIGFHMKLLGLDFKSAVRDLLGPRP